MWLSKKKYFRSVINKNLIGKYSKRPIEGLYGRQPIALKLANYNSKSVFEIRISSVLISLKFANINNLILSTRKYFWDEYFRQEKKSCAI